MAHDFEGIERVDGYSLWRHRGNGLKVVTLATPVAPVVSFGVVYGVGSRHEVSGHTGATHLLEHLMFKGTERYNRERGTEVARVLQRVGAEFNATTWLDRTSYFETLPVEHLPLAVDVEADRMRNARVRPEDLESERTVVLNELASGDNDPFELLLKESLAHVFLEHPYRHPTIGWRGDVERVEAATLRRFYDLFYHPDNATAIVVGDLEEEAALAAVEAGFGAILPAPTPAPVVATVEGEQRGERRFEIHRAGELGCLALTWRIPAGLDPDTPALVVLTQVLAEGVTSRLYQRLVESNRCLAVHAYALQLHDPGVFQVVATLAPGVAHREVEDTIRATVEELRRSPPSPAEVARARRQSRTELAFHRESPAQILSGLTEAIALGDWRRFVRELELVEAVDAGDLERVAAAHLTDRRLTVGWFIPEGGRGAAGPPAPPRPRPCYLHAPFVERVVERELPGGARLAVLANPHAPTATVLGTLRAGAACAGDGRFTVPGLTAAMLDRGTASYSRLALASELEDHGLHLAIRSSPTAPASVTVSAAGLAEELPRLVGLLEEVLRRPVFPSEELERLRQRVRSALVRELDDTSAQAFAALTRRLYPASHPLYRRPVEERLAELDRLTAAELEAFHARVYGPASLVLAVVGAVDAELVHRLLGEALEGWSGGLAAAPSWAEPDDPEPAEDLVAMAERPNLDVVLGHPGRLRRTDPDLAAALLANSCLGQSTLTSRLGAAVRDREGLTYGVYSRFLGTRDLPGPWAVFLGVAPENLRRAVALCRQVIEDYVAEGPTESELADERQALAGSYRVGLATNSGVARELAAALAHGGGVAWLDEHPERLLATSRGEVHDAVRRHLRPGALVLAAAGTLPDEG